MKRMLEGDVFCFFLAVTFPSKPVWSVNQPKVLVTVMRLVFLVPVSLLYSSGM